MSHSCFEICKVATSRSRIQWYLLFVELKYTIADKNSEAGTTYIVYNLHIYIYTLGTINKNCIQPLDSTSWIWILYKCKSMGNRYIQINLCISWANSHSSYCLASSNQQSCSDIRCQAIICINYDILLMLPLSTQSWMLHEDVTML